MQDLEALADVELLWDIRCEESVVRGLHPCVSHTRLPGIAHVRQVCSRLSSVLLLSVFFHHAFSSCSCSPRYVQHALFVASLIFASVSRGGGSHNFSPRPTRRCVNYTGGRAWSQKVTRLSLNYRMRACGPNFNRQFDGNLKHSPHGFYRKVISSDGHTLPSMPL